jgi:hypothetical protein
MSRLRVEALCAPVHDGGGRCEPRRRASADPVLGLVGQENEAKYLEKGMWVPL